ncbi:MAG: efflux RND transporter permease subunit [Myxococcota bacterium]
MIRRLEQILFGHRASVLGILALSTVAMGVLAAGVRLDTAFENQLPLGHPYVETFLEYRDQMTGVNRVVVALESSDGDIWTPTYFRRLSELTDTLAFLPGIDRRSVTSLWTPNIRSIEITEDGMRSEDMIGSGITVDSLDDAEIARIRDRVLRSGLVGRLVSRDFSTAMVVAEAVDVGLDTAQDTGVLELAASLEAEVRSRFDGNGTRAHIIGFVPMIGEIAEGARTVVLFFCVAFVLTGLAVYAYSRSWILTALPLFCSFVSGIWQFGAMAGLGYGVDPLAILVPFLVFAIGVSHGIQQINRIARRTVEGDDIETASRAAFRDLLVPGSMALMTDLIAFATLVLIPIPMVKDLGVTAAIGVAFKIVSNLVMLPVLASYFPLDHGYAERRRRSQDLAARVMNFVARLARPVHARRTLAAFAIIFGVAAWQGQGRRVGDLQPGATELRPGSRYNQDAARIVERFDLGLDVLTVLAETPPDSCVDHDVVSYLDRFSWHMTNVPGVMSVMSTPVVAKVINAAWNEGRLTWRALPRNRYALAQVTSSIPSGLGVYSADCRLMPVQIFTSDHRAETIEQVMAGATAFIAANPHDRVELRLASGNVGIQAATNQALERAEVPMMLWAYGSIVLLVTLTYRSFRAILCCCLPLCVATFLGYWFLKELDIGLKVSTLPVMVLAVGIGVDYAFYIFSRLELYLRRGVPIGEAYRRALVETGNAVVFTAITLAIGVSTWAFSPLKFQADMGLLLAFMFFINMAMSVTLLPALAVVLNGGATSGRPEDPAP